MTHIDISPKTRTDRDIRQMEWLARAGALGAIDVLINEVLEDWPDTLPAVGLWKLSGIDAHINALRALTGKLADLRGVALKGELDEEV